MAKIVSVRRTISFFLALISMIALFAISSHALPDEETLDETTITETEKRYIEDLSTANWDSVIFNRIIVECDETIVPNEKEWTVNDFPELDLKDVHDFGSYLTLILKTDDKESLVEVFNSVAKRMEFISVFLDRAIPVDPTWPSTDVETTANAPESIDKEATTVVVTDETGNTSKPKTGDKAIYAVIVAAVSATIVLAVIRYRKKYND